MILNGEPQAKSKKEYITNLIIIFNSFFEYGFIRRGTTTSSSTGGGPYTAEEASNTPDNDE